jgi:hypothetical protein
MKRDGKTAMAEQYHSAAEWQSETLVSVFTSATGTRPKTVTLSSVLEDVRTGLHAGQIELLRRILARDRATYDREKKKLPAFTISGTARSRTEPGCHSGLLQVDLDKLGDGLGAIRERLKLDPHVAFGFVSPSGQGLKLGLLIDGSRHSESFAAAEVYFRERYNVTIDPKCKDRLRLCFVSDDPGLWSNPAPVRLPLQERVEAPSPTDRGSLATEPDKDSAGRKASTRYSSESCILNACGTASLDACVPASLHNNADRVLGNIAARSQAQTALAAKNPVLAKLYADFIEPRFQARPGARNGFITDAVPFLYRAVATPFVLELVVHFYDCNRALFKDSRDQHMKEAQAMLESVTQIYAASLTEGERRIYEALPEQERNAFRICRDLALLERPERQRGEFYMSFNQLGDRLGIYPMQAQRIMRQLEIYGLITLVRQGTRRAAGVRGEAGVYRLQLMPPQKTPSEIK